MAEYLQGVPSPHKYWDRQVWAKSLDPDQVPQDVASEKGLHCQLFTQQSTHQQVVI